MARELAEDQELAGGRYVVKKTVEFSDEGGLYRVVRPEDSTKWALKELIPPSGLSEALLEERLTQVREAVELLMHFDHPNLGRVEDQFTENGRHYVVMEWMEGIPLEKLMEMSVKPQPEEKVLQWADVLAKAIHYCHDRPVPYVFKDLTLKQVMLDSSETIKLFNYGLGRFLRPDDEFFEEKPNAVRTAYDAKALGRMLSILLTKSEPGPVGLGADDPGSPELKRLINRLVSLRAGSEPLNMSEILTQIDKIINPPVQEEYVRSYSWHLYTRLIGWQMTYTRGWSEASHRFLKQPLWLVLVEFVLLLAAGGWLWHITHPPLIPRDSKAVYVACGREIYVIKTKDRQVLTRIQVPSSEIYGLAVAQKGRKMFASVPSERRLLVLNSVSNRWSGLVPVHDDPRQMEVDPLERRLFVIHPAGNSVSVIDIDRAPLGMEDKDTLLAAPDKMIALLAVGRQAGGAAIASALPEDVGEEVAAELVDALPLKLDAYLTSTGGNQVFHYTFPPDAPPTPVASTFVDSAGPAVLSKDGRLVYVGSVERGRVQAFRTANLSPGPTAVDIGGDEPVQLLVSPVRDEVWSVNASGTLGVLNAAELDLRETVELGGSPSWAAFTMDGEDEQLWVALRDTGELLLVNAVARRVEERIKVGSTATSLVIAE